MSVSIDWSINVILVDGSTAAPPPSVIGYSVSLVSSEILSSTIIRSKPVTLSTLLVPASAE